MGLGTKVNYTEVDYTEVERFTMEKYPFIKDYEFACVQESGNDTSYTFNVNGKLDKWDLEDWDKIKSSGTVHNYRNRLVLNKLCADGHIEPGEYLIKVSW